MRETIRRKARVSELPTLSLHPSALFLILLLTLSASPLVVLALEPHQPSSAPQSQSPIEREAIGGQRWGYPLYRFPPKPWFRAAPEPRRGPGSILHRVEPAFTEEAARARIRGVVVAELYIDEGGVVRAVRIVKGLPFGLDDKAVEAFGEWRFEPAREEGKAVPSVTFATVYFPPNELPQQER